jgi:hypothetical protein
MRALLSVLACASLASVAWGSDKQAVSASADVKLFIGCPIYRDTDAGRKSGCWLVTNPADGQRYDISYGRIKPILGRKVLVEGIPSSRDSNACGAPVLDPVSVSVLEGECKPHLIPAEGHPGHRFVLPQDVMQPLTVPRQLPPPPYQPQHYTIEFDLNDDFLVYQYSEVILERAALYAQASNAREVRIAGYAATQPIEVSGERIVEELAIAKARVAMIAEAFARLGIARERMTLSWHPASSSSYESPLREAAKRRVEIAVLP